MTSYKIVWHKIFKYQYEHLKNNPPLKRQVDTQLQVIASDPANAGAALKFLPSDLVGKVKKLRVGGRKGYRMFIKTDHHEKIVKIGFVASVKRGHLDYKKLPLYLIDLPEDRITEKTLREFIIK